MFLVFFFSLSFYLLHLFYLCNPSLLCFLTKNEKDCEKYNLDLENYKYLPSRFVGLLQLTAHLVAGNLRLPFGQASKNFAIAQCVIQTKRADWLSARVSPC